MECEIPAVNVSPEEQKEIFGEVKTIAVVGLSPDSSKDSHRVAKYLQEQGYKIIPVYPKEEHILGEKVYRTVLEIDCAVDLVNVFRKPEAVNEIVDQIIRKGNVKVLWLQIGIVNNNAAQIAARAGIKVVQNRCIMVDHRKYKTNSI